MILLNKNILFGPRNPYHETTAIVRLPENIKNKFDCFNNMFEQHSGSDIVSRGTSYYESIIIINWLLDNDINFGLIFFGYYRYIGENISKDHTNQAHIVYDYRNPDSEKLLEIQKYIQHINMSTYRKAIDLNERKISMYNEDNIRIDCSGCGITLYFDEDIASAIKLLGIF